MTTSLIDPDLEPEPIFSVTKPAAEDEMEDEEPEYATVIIEPFEKVEDPSSIKASSPKRYIAAVLAVDWVVQAGTSRTLQSRAPFKTGTRAGQPQPDVDVQHLWVFAHRKGYAGFLAHFADNRFKEARVWDAIGWPTELYFDYSPNARQLKRQKDEPEKAYQARVDRTMRDARRMNYEYNDGTSILVRAPRYITAGMTFDEWLADLIPDFEPRKKRAPSTKQTQATASAVDLIKIGEWIG